MAYYIRNGNTFRVTDEAAVDIQRQLPPSTFVVKVDQFGNFFLELTDPFTPLSKVYGDSLANAGRIMSTFRSRPSGTGVLLAGEKGSGKTMLAKQISIDAAAIGIPTILVNTPFCGDPFNKFMQDIDMEAVVLFDEFEKIYDSAQQEALLTLLDGVYPTKKLFVLTCNDKWRVDQHMRNRPGRIFYMLDFEGLSIEFVREYCEDNLLNQDYVEAVCRMSLLFAKFNFDMLKALVEEMNRYNEDPQAAIRLLNAKPEYSDKVAFNIEVVHEGKQIPKDWLDTKQWSGNPLTQALDVWFRTAPDEGEKAPVSAEKLSAALNAMVVEWDEFDDQPVPVPKKRRKKNVDGDENWKSVVINAGNLHKIDAETGVFIFKKDNTFIALTRVVQEKFNYYGAAF